METNPQRIEGKWDKGYALGLHTLSSAINPDGSFDTKRTEIGEALNRLKYHDDQSQIAPLAESAADFLEKRDTTDIAAIIPVPPSDLSRRTQPVIEVAKALGKTANIKVDFAYLTKVKDTPGLKGIDDPSERKKILKGAFGVSDGRYKGRAVLLFDDLFRSGSTLNEICDTLKSKGGVATIYVLTLTRTRVKR